MTLVSCDDCECHSQVILDQFTVFSWIIVVPHDYYSLHKCLMTVYDTIYKSQYRVCKQETAVYVCSIVSMSFPCAANFNRA